MDSYRGWPTEEDGRGIRFTGNWREFLPIAATNALLIIVTLGVYRFWATARQRRYLWSRTHVIDDSLEWTGTGKEMFLGFLIVVAFLLPFFLFIQFLFPALVARGKEAAAGGVLFLFYIAMIYLGGVARFRALRYRLSRSWWHGIRGGSDDPGWNYGGEYLGRHALSIMTMFIMFPWAATRLWNARWNAMSFGPDRFRVHMRAEGLKLRWALVYMMPVAAILLGIGMYAAVSGQSPEEAAPGGGMGMAVLGIVLFLYIGIPLLTLNWFAKFYRRAAEETKLGGLEFGFDANTWDWLKLFLGNIALAIVTLGFGLTYWGYRNWSFMVRHARIHGVVDLSQLTQSQVAAPTEAEGFADAFDVGAI
ncbi:MAG: YjgN family protein [Pseudomonadota bacterium]|nr:YjgN family protein [Pseudomonadota bacterium]